MGLLAEHPRDIQEEARDSKVRAGGWGEEGC